jgi:hypothetical protein
MMPMTLIGKSLGYSIRLSVGCGMASENKGLA